MRLSTIGRQPFSISKTSPGLQLLVQLLVQLLSTPKANLGYAAPLMPAVKHLGQRRINVQYLVNQGSAHQGYGSWVFRVRLEADDEAILKQSQLSQEINKPPVTLMHQ